MRERRDRATDVVPVREGTSAGLSRTGVRLVLLITVLSVAHHVDHVLRGVTGWPIDGGFNPFSASLLVYPVIAAVALASRRGRVGAGAWAALASGGALFVAAVHLGPAAGDAIGDIPGGHDAGWQGVLALAVLAALLAALVAHWLHEVARLRQAR